MFYVYFLLSTGNVSSMRTSSCIWRSYAFFECWDYMRMPSQIIVLPLLVFGMLIKYGKQFLVIILSQMLIYFHRYISRYLCTECCIYSAFKHIPCNLCRDVDYILCSTVNLRLNFTHYPIFSNVWGASERVFSKYSRSDEAPWLVNDLNIKFVFQNHPNSTG